MLVEDDENDVFIFERALEAAGVANPLQIAWNGTEAINYLSGADKYADRARFPLPFIVFLDLKLPYIDGFDVLRWIREQPELEEVVVVALAPDDLDQATAYKLGARSYLVKPPEGPQILQLFRSLESYWKRSDAAGPVLDGLA